MSNRGGASIAASTQSSELLPGTTVQVLVEANGAMPEPLEARVVWRGEKAGRHRVGVRFVGNPSRRLAVLGVGSAAA